ncbi:MAG: hypothetical protein M1819_005234 [Sarea resinae]|nr:MAG: hypothetical protein M1819_005234 [Sarea resinae]
MAKSPAILKLSNELLREILDHIEADPEKSVSIDRRAYLSVESFRPPSPPVPAQAQDIGHFRLVCRRFAELGIPHQFTRVTVRFSRKDLLRLETIADHAHIAEHVKKFSYMVPCFYVEGRARIRELFRDFQGELGALDAGHFIRKALDQMDIVRSQDDLRALKKAAVAFTSLQHVQILRLQDEADRHLLDFIRDNRDLATQLVDLRWTPACIHGSKTVGEALFEARSPYFQRFSGPQMNPQSVIALKDSPTRIVSSLAARLTCLELHFDEGFELDAKMRELSPLFKTVFSAATAMQAVHVGFPSRFPLGLKLEEIFHGIRWEKLRAFGIQAWRLDAEEIVSLARRHRRTLRGLRLRDILLKEGSMWKDVLGMLREEMELLDWVSLRRIGYSKSFDEQWAGSVEVPEDPPGSDSDDEDEFPHHMATEDDGDYDDDDDDEEFDDTDESIDNDSDQGPEANELALSPDTPSSVPWCNCGQGMYPGSADELGDNGFNVDYLQRKLWEKWVIGRCPEHSSS